MTNRIMRDSTNPNNIPLSGAQLVAGYDDGNYTNLKALSARFPHITNVSIDVNGSMPQADVRDWEPGNKTGNLEQWVIDHNKFTGHQDAVIYSDRSDLPEVRNLTKSQILGVNYWLWQANLDGTVTAIYPQSTVAVQVKDVNNLYDESLVTMDWWKAAPIVNHGQDNWHWCRKCQGMWYLDGKNYGHCPAGGIHSTGGSGNYHQTWH